MRHAKETACRRGWEFFREAAPRPSRDEINEFLASAGLPEVSKRMYDHYGRLARHEVVTYMPINDFDMALKHGTLGRRTA